MPKRRRQLPEDVAEERRNIGPGECGKEEKKETRFVHRSAATRTNSSSSSVDDRTGLILFSRGGSRTWIIFADRFQCFLPIYKCNSFLSDAIGHQRVLRSATRTEHTQHRNANSKDEEVIRFPRPADERKKLFNLSNGIF